jgi:hypothetical protein
MMQRLLVPALWLLPIVAWSADEAIPIEQEPRHKLVFENAHVRYFDVELEPGYESRYHWHRADGVFVNISSAPTIAQDLGKDPVRRGERAIGETYFIDYGARPKAHRVSNPGTTPYHVVDTELLGGCGPADPAGEGPNQTLLIDNERVLVTRIILHPGESTKLYSPCGMLVSVSGGSVTLDGEPVDMSPAGFKWRQQERATTLVNTGKFVFHGVDIRLK